MKTSFFLANSTPWLSSTDLEENLSFEKAAL
jgi:hypothetical protein